MNDSHHGQNAHGHAASWSRRRFLALTGGSIGASLLVAACGQPAAPAPASGAAPSKPAAPAASTGAPAVAEGKPADSAAAAAAKPAPATAPGTVLVWTFVDAINGADTRGKATKSSTDRFMQAHPNTKVQFEITPWPQLGNKYQAAWEAGNAPDAVWVRMDWLTTQVKQGALAVMDDRVAAKPKDDIDDLAWKSLWDSGVVNGKRYTLYQWPIMLTLQYRKDVADRAGVKPIEAKTFDQWIPMMQKMTIDKAGKSVDQSGFDPSQVAVWGYGEGRARRGGNDLRLEAVMLSAGDQLLKDDSTANWTSPVGIRALTYWTDMITKHKVQSKEDVTRDQANADKNFIGGLYSIYGGGSAKFADVRKQASGWDGKSLAVMQVPGLEKPCPVEAPGWYLGMNSKAKNPDGAWAWLEYYTSREADLEMVKTGGQLPIRKSTLNDPYFQSEEAAYIKSYLDLVSTYGSFVSGWASSPVNPSDDILLAFQSVVTDNVPVEKAAQDAADAYDARVKEARAG
jgi:multiple sugar transport system substrate-binding protein